MTNPYFGMPLDRLVDAVNSLSNELQEIRPRTAAERRDLAQRCKFALRTVVSELNPSPHLPGNPERRAAGELGKIRSIFLEWHAMEIQATRYRTMRRAESLVFGDYRPPSALWQPDYRTEESLGDALQQLQDMATGKRPKPGQS